MSRLIASYPKATLVSVSKRSGMDDNDWRWREDLVGQSGAVEVYEIARKTFKEFFVIFDSDNDSCLITGCGELQNTDIGFEIITTNSHYCFRLQQGGVEA